MLLSVIFISELRKTAFAQVYPTLFTAKILKKHVKVCLLFLMLLYLKYTPKAVIGNNKCFIRERSRQMAELIVDLFENREYLPDLH